MHLVYVDESGDPGTAVSSSRYFILCGLLVHHADWHDVRSQLNDLRERLKSMHGLSPDAEIHAAEFLSSSRNHLGLNQRQRIQCLLHLLGFLERTQKLKPFRVSIDKLIGNNDPLATAWSDLAIKLTNLVEISVHEKCTAEGLIIISDDLRPSPGRRWIKQALQADSKLDQLLIDLPFGRESHQSDLLQLSDLLSFLTKQTLMPNHFFSGPSGKALLRRYHRLWKAENDKGR
jgi:hypothetical protein